MALTTSMKNIFNASEILGFFPSQIELEETNEMKKINFKFRRRVIFKMAFLLFMIPANTINTFVFQFSIFRSFNFGHILETTQFTLLDFVPFNMINMTAFVSTIAYFVAFNKCRVVPISLLSRFFSKTGFCIKMKLFTYYDHKPLTSCLLTMTTNLGPLCMLTMITNFGTPCTLDHLVYLL